jgi:hypothetical protein
MLKIRSVDAIAVPCRLSTRQLVDNLQESAVCVNWQLREGSIR